MFIHFEVHNCNIFRLWYIIIIIIIKINFKVYSP